MTHLGAETPVGKTSAEKDSLVKQTAPHKTQQPLPLVPKALSLAPFPSHLPPSSCDESAGTGAPAFQGPRLHVPSESSTCQADPPSITSHSDKPSFLFTKSFQGFPLLLVPAVGPPAFLTSSLTTSWPPVVSPPAFHQQELPPPHCRHPFRRSLASSRMPEVGTPLGMARSQLSVSHFSFSTDELIS